MSITITIQLEKLEGYSIGPDSYWVPRFLQQYTLFDPDQVLADINDVAPWTDPQHADFRYRGHVLARQKFFLNDAPIEAPADQPPALLHRYFYPGFQYGSMSSYRPFRAVPVVHEIATFLQQEMEFGETGVSFNHVIGTRYRDATDNIGWHADKTQDIRPDTPIVMLSLGETRELQLGKPHGKNGKPTKLTHAIPFAHGDLFVLGPRTNEQMMHRIAKVAQERLVKREGGEVAPRVSLVFRDIGTQITLDNARQKAQRVRRDRERRQQDRKRKREGHE
jgi:alkylated DNA repair dioxygenase AlkB